MKKVRSFFAPALAAICLLLASCVNHISGVDENAQLTFNVGLGVEVEGMTRAASGEELSNAIAALDFYDCANGSVAEHISQKSSDDGFGKVSLSVPYGRHEFYFIGHNSASCTLAPESGECSFDRVLDTFTYYVAMDVDDETEGLQTVTLKRQVAQIKVVLDDAIPQNAHKMRISVEEYAPTLQARTGKGTGTVKLEREWEYSDTHIGATGSTYRIYGFVPAEGHTTQVSVAVEDAAGAVISQSILADVPMRKNCTTKISGKFFSNDIQSDIEVDVTWDEEIEVPILP